MLPSLYGSIQVPQLTGAWEGRGLWSPVSGMIPKCSWSKPGGLLKGKQLHPSVSTRASNIPPLVVGSQPPRTQSPWYLLPALSDEVIRGCYGVA